MPMSISLDTYNNFEQFLEAYSVEVLSESGDLLLEGLLFAVLLLSR